MIMNFEHHGSGAYPWCSPPVLLLGSVQPEDHVLGFISPLLSKSKSRNSQQILYRVKQVAWRVAPFSLLLSCQTAIAQCVSAVPAIVLFMPRASTKVGSSAVTGNF